MPEQNPRGSKGLLYLIIGPTVNHVIGSWY